MSSPAPEKPRFVIVPHRPHIRVLLVVGLVLWVLSLVAVYSWATMRAAPGLAEAREGLAVNTRRAAQAEALVRETSATVERLRRLRFKAPVTVEVVDSAAARNADRLEFA